MKHTVTSEEDHKMLRFTNYILTVKCEDKYICQISYFMSSIWLHLKSITLKNIFKNISQSKQRSEVTFFCRSGLSSGIFLLQQELILLSLFVLLEIYHLSFCPSEKNYLFCLHVERECLPVWDCI